MGLRKQLVDQPGASSTRRNALKATGGIAVGLLATRWGGGLTLAQEASPVAGNSLEGRYALVRKRTLKEGVNAQEVNQTVEEGYLPLLREVPGFVAYIATENPTNTDSTYTVIMDDKAGTEESNRLAAEFLTSNNYDWFEGDPQISEGVIDFAIGSLTAASTTSAVASPVAAEPLEGRYLVLRVRTRRADASAAEVDESLREDLLPQIESTPGFIAYFVVNEESTRELFAVGIFADEADADESTERAAEWLASGAEEYVEDESIVVEGVIDIGATA